ncbi:MAG TPA: hypothetical protein VKB72_15945 [Steroidobacteraceae bacterium]|nr:hypothetical protein [Steroidobacteraceae bacterium]
MDLVVMALVLFAALAVCLDIGYRLGARRVRTTPNAHEGFGAIEGAVFGLFGLLLSLSFFGAATRLDARRQLMVRETNAIADAYMRVDLLPSTAQPEVRHLFREYLDARLSISQDTDEAVAESELRHAAKLQHAIWSRAVSANHDGAPGAALLLTAVNQMAAIEEEQAIAMQTHLPLLVFYLLVASALLSALVAGFGMARGTRNWLSIFVYASIVTLTLYVMIDMEFPRQGLIRIGAADRSMSELRDSIQ